MRRGQFRVGLVLMAIEFAWLLYWTGVLLGAVVSTTDAGTPYRLVVYIMAFHAATPAAIATTLSDDVHGWWILVVIVYVLVTDLAATLEVQLHLTVTRDVYGWAVYWWLTAFLTAWALALSAASLLWYGLVYVTQQQQEEESESEHRHHHRHSVRDELRAFRARIFARSNNNDDKHQTAARRKEPQRV